MEHNVEHIRREAFKEGVKEGKLKERVKILQDVQGMLDAVGDLSHARQLIRAWRKRTYKPRAALPKSIKSNLV